MPEIYEAPAPSYTVSSWALFWARYLLIVPLLTDPLKWLVTRLAGTAVGRMILGAQNIQAAPMSEHQVADWLQGNGLAGMQYTVTTDDHATLDTLEIRPQALDNVMQRPYIINFLGSAQHYQDNLYFPLLDMIRDDARQQHCTVIAFNYRNVVGSTKAPSSFEDLVTDGIAQVQRLLTQGVPPANIVLNGVSLGAGIATLVAAHFHSHDIPVRLFSDRGFSSLARTIAGWIQIGVVNDMLNNQIQQVRNDDGITGYTRPFGKKLLGWLALPFLKAALYLTGWDIDVSSAYHSIPSTHKALLRIQSSVQRRQENPPPVDDCIIPEAAQLEPSIGDLVGNMQTMNPQKQHDAHFKMRGYLRNKENPSQTGIQFYHHALQRFFQPPPAPALETSPLLQMDQVCST